MGIQIAVLLALLFFLIIFLAKDNSAKKRHRNRSIKHEKSWIDYKRKLPKYIP